MWFLDVLIALSGKSEAKATLNLFKRWINGAKVDKRTNTIFSQVKNVFEKGTTKDKKTIADFIYNEFNKGGRALKRQFGAKQKEKWKYDNRGIYAFLTRKRRAKNALERQHDENAPAWDSAVLSSSWLVAGSFAPKVHSLEITTIQGRSYIYPNVSRDTWEAMKAARGKNGTGAGSVFWDKYLHKKDWLHSGLRRHIIENVHPAFYEQQRRDFQKEVAKQNIAKYINKMKFSYYSKQRKQKAMKGVGS